VRLRFINAGAMTFFNVRIPGLTMQVVAADGQDVRPVAVDEFQFGPGETYDVIVNPAPAPTPSRPKRWTVPAWRAARWRRQPAWPPPCRRCAPPAADHEGYGHGYARHGHEGHEHARRILAPQVAMGPGWT
jgi:FtsP/CotA-like multicopper oxidase with cupredoxin domain